MDNENQTTDSTEDHGVSNPLDHESVGSATTNVVEHPMEAYADGVDAGHDHDRHKKRRRATIGAALALVLILSAVAIGVSGPGSSDAAAQVELGARTTLAAHSALLNISGSISLNGQTIPVTGSGAADLSYGLVNVTFSFRTNGTTVNETELADGTNVYMQIVGNGKNEISTVLPGKTWLEIPAGSKLSSGVGSGTNIMTQLQVLTQQGNTVASLGSSTINGVAVTGYQVTFSPTAMAAAVKRVVSQLGSSGQTLKSLLLEFSKNPPVIKLWIDASHLLRREEGSVNISSAGVSESVDLNIDFNNYGTPITVTVPSANDVGSYSAFLRAAQAAS